MAAPALHTFLEGSQHKLADELYARPWLHGPINTPFRQGWIMQCTCGWETEPCHTLESAGLQFDAHLRKLPPAVR